ncbi:HD domain-containing phosphohydrolase [Halobacteriovorax sp. JY17]|uniref:HD-GYP domain-containing protein n=1 Tax=Halobacteriovorax sp. JY17 TaxID=2014617 RepID=UPI000C5753FD|nr:HD domain-containing phosphohydrolase [Halobacteriovorax sp. JY17]PIK15840.1 MAG: phosphohydrolase [Halobacteriovorax sp. JY17]
MKENKQQFSNTEIDDGLDELEKSHRLNRFESMLKFSRVISGSLSLKDIIKKAQGHTRKLLESEHVCIYLKDKSADYLSMTDQMGEEHSIAIDENSVVGSSAYLQATLKIDKGVSDIRFAREVLAIKKLRPKSMLVIPMVLNGELLGVIQATNSLNNNFNEQDIQFGEAVATQLTPVIQNAYLYEELHKQFIQVVEALADTITKKDSYTGGHTKRVSHFAMKIGSKLNLSWEEMNDLRLAAVLHDIGKIGIEDAILKKKAPLTDDEFAVMREHPRLGYEILKNVDSLSRVVDGMRFHHERPDGTGYPYGLKGDEIPIIAMIISVADTFDAMISTRPYRKGLPPMVAYEEIRKYSGTQFSSNVVEAFSEWFESTKMYSVNRLDSKKKAS